DVRADDGRPQGLAPHRRARRHGEERPLALRERSAVVEVLDRRQRSEGGIPDDALAGELLASWNARSSLSHARDHSFRRRGLEASPRARRSELAARRRMGRWGRQRAARRSLERRENEDRQEDSVRPKSSAKTKTASRARLRLDAVQFLSIRRSIAAEAGRPERISRSCSERTPRCT